MKKLFTILALALAMVACQKDGNVEEFSNGDLATVTLNLDAPALGVTRAGENGQDDATNGKESAYGAIDYADDAFWAKYDLRYILEVYSAEDDGTGANIARERLYSFKDEYAPTEFQVRLVPNRTYKFVVWADFVLHTTAADGDFDNDDLYYNTADLRTISAITTGDWNAMNEARDAYFVSQNLDIKKDVAQNLTLKRPLAKIRVVTTDKEHWSKYSQPSRVEVKYYESELSNVFNAVNGQIDTTKPLQKRNYNVVYAEAESQYNETDTHKTLFADYLFVKPAADGQTPIHFTMDVYEGANHDVLVRSNDFCTEIPIKRNHLTTIYGDILTTMSDITVGINDNFDLEEKVDYDEDKHSNDAGNSAPVITPEGENAEGVTEVSFANGAYTIATDQGINVNIMASALKERKLETGVYTYGVDFTVDDFDYAVPATASKFNQTAAATVKATVVGGTMEVSHKTSGEQVIDLELNITYKANETVVEATAAYTMTSKFEFAEIEQVALATPVVEATVSENTVTLAWTKVDNAANYSITVGTEMPVFTEECTYTFTGEYDTDYVFYVVAVPADELLYLPSAAAEVEARTAAEVTDDPEVETYYVYVDEQNGWSHVYLYAWWGTAEDECIAGWPGVELKDTKNIDGTVYLVYTIPAECNGKTLQFVVNNGEGKQTPDSEPYLINKDVFLTVEAEEIVVPDKPWEPAADQLVFEPHDNWTQANARFAAYFFGTAGEAWSGMTVVPGKPGIYYTTKPAGAFEKVIFCRMNPSASANNWNNKWNQTGDLEIPTDGKNYYRLTGGEWDGVTGSWSTYAVDYAPTKLNAPRVDAAVEGNVVTLSWNAVANAEYYTVNGEETASPYVFEGEYNTPYTFSVVSCSDDARFAASDAVVVEVTTEAEPTQEPEEPEQPEVTYTTVADFLAAAEDETTMYTLKGTITAVANTSYGNFDLTDETGTVLIYGLMSPDGATNKYWATSGAKLGDDIVVKTIRASFNGTPQGKNAWFVELITPGTRAFFTLNPTAVDFPSAGGESTVTVTAYNTTDAVTAVSNNDAFVVVVDGYNVKVSAAANEIEEEISGQITVKVGDLEPAVINVSLAAKPAAGQVEGGADDFNTISATNTSYVSGKTTAGWSYTNCAIFKGGTSDSSPAFKMIGDANNRALCMNGKTSAVGTITSPTINTGCGTLKFNYGLPFSDNMIKFRVDIKQNGEVVKTFTVDNSSATKLTKYSFEEAIDVAGEFQIVFTNLSPSGSTSNKDRTAIWDVEWTGVN